MQVDACCVAGVTGRDHALDHDHVVAHTRLLVQANDRLEQFVQLAIAQHPFDLGKAQRRRRHDAMGTCDQLGGALRAGVAWVGLGNRLEEAHFQAGALQRAHKAQADGRKADAKVGWCDEKSLHACFSK